MIIREYYSHIIPNWDFTWQINVADLLNWNNWETWCKLDVTIYDSNWNSTTDNYTGYCYSSWTKQFLFIPYLSQWISSDKIYVFNRNCWNWVECAKEIIRNKIIRIKMWQLIWNICYDSDNNDFTSCN